MLSEIYKELYNYLYSKDISPDEDYRLNHIGWNSAFDGKPYSSAVMHEWRNDTCEQIRRFTHDRIFELACGTGMLLFSLIGDAEFYCGADISEKGIEYIKNHLSAEEETKVRLEVADARRIDEIDEKNFDIAVINSATQYMGPEKEFTRVITMLADKVRTGGKIFLGDMKSAKLRDTFYKTAELWNGDTQNLEARIHKRQQNDFEFYISSEYLESLKDSISRIKHIDLLMKQGIEKTEMNMFRFNAVLYLDEYPEKIYETVHAEHFTAEETQNFLSNTEKTHIQLQGYKNRHLEGLPAKEGGNVLEDRAVYAGEICAIAKRCGFNAYASVKSDDMRSFDVYCEKR